MTDGFKRRFLKLKVTGQRCAVSTAEKRSKDLELISFLQEAIRRGELSGIAEQGFALWNISDSYALLKRPQELYENHLKFYKLLKLHASEYLFWMVSDATQKLTLEAGGYADFWWSLYHEACKKNTKHPEPFLEFTAHKAALYTTESLPHKKENALAAAWNFERLLEHAKNLPEYTFYKAIYRSLAVRHGLSDASELIDIFEKLLDGLTQPKGAKSFLTGEWPSFTTPPSKRQQCEQGITATVNALIDTGNALSAQEVYQTAVNAGLPQNRYIEKRLSRLLQY